MEGVFQFLLSETSPWPMMQNGLLHSPPKYVREKFSSLFYAVKSCVESKREGGRFEASNVIIDVLESILGDHKVE